MASPMVDTVGSSMDDAMESSMAGVHGRRPLTMPWRVSMDGVH